MASRPTASPVETGVGPIGASVAVGRLRHLATVFGWMPRHLASEVQAFRTALDCAPYGRSGAGAAAAYLSHKFVRNARPEKTSAHPGIIHLGADAKQKKAGPYAEQEPAFCIRSTGGFP